jgi:type II secretory pathway component PulJ
MKTHIRIHTAKAAARAGRDGGRSGFSLPEVLVTLLLSLSVIGSVMSVYMSHQKSFLVATSFIDVQNDARQAMEHMVRDGRWAVELVSSKSGYNSNESCIVLKVPSIDASNDIIDIENNFDYFVYRLNGSNLERILTDCDESSVRKNWHSPVTVANNVDSLSFTFKDINNNTTGTPANAYGVNISLTVGQTAVAAAGTRATENLATTIKFRNKEIP